MLHKDATTIVCPEAFTHFFIYLFMQMYTCMYVCVFSVSLSIYLFASCVFTLRRGLTKLYRLNWNIFCSSSKPLICCFSASASLVARIICLYQEVQTQSVYILFIHFQCLCVRARACMWCLHMSVPPHECGCRKTILRSMFSSSILTFQRSNSSQQTCLASHLPPTPQYNS